MADNEGNIGYLLINDMPERKSNKPYVGCKVIDGTTSKNDWIGYKKPRNMPRVVNPKKGYIVTANNR